MKNNLLLPNFFRKTGRIFLFSGCFIFLLVQIFALKWSDKLPKLSFVNNDAMGNLSFLKINYEFENIYLIIWGGLILFGLLLTAFSKLKVEDEYTFSMRLNALLWAVLVYYAMFIIFYFFVRGAIHDLYLQYNWFLLLIIYELRFEYLLLSSKRSAYKTEHHKFSHPDDDQQESISGHSKH